MLWSRVDDNTRLMVIWTEVKPPGYSPIDPAGSGQAEMDLVKTYGVWNSGTSRYEWTDLGSGQNDPNFSDPGTYQIFYFAKDNITGNVSALMESKVYKAKDSNSPPDSFFLLSPEDGASELTTLILDWEDTTDPDGDSLTYKVLLSKDNASFSSPIKKDGLEYSTCLISSDDGIEDLSDYYWKVQAIDEYGAIRESGVSVFSTNNTNPVRCWVEGHVSDASTSSGLPIVDAEVNIGGTPMNTALKGYYLGMVSPGTYTITASAPGYQPITNHGVVFPEGDLITKNFALDPFPVKGDINGDGVLTQADLDLAFRY
jgi:Carboxypeptidase regulatory-like domain